MKHRLLLTYILIYFAGISVGYKLSALYFMFFLTALLLLQKFWKIRFIISALLFLGGILVCTITTTQIDQRINQVTQLTLPDQPTIQIDSDVNKPPSDVVSFDTYFQGLLFKAYISNITSLTNYECGDQLMVNKLTPSPLKRNTNFDITTYDDYLKLHKYAGRIYIRERDILQYQKPPFSLKRQMYRLRDRLAQVQRDTLPLPQAQMINSIIFGTASSYIDAETQSKYKRAGIIHLLVVSGSQIAILTGCALGLATYLKLSPGLSFAFVSLCNIFFTIATGAGASILRACLMAQIVLFGKYLHRESDIYTTLALSALLMSLYNPLIIFDIGFQLSFAATLSLVYMTPPLEKQLAKYLAPPPAKMVATTIAPFCFTTPLAVYYFNGISLVSLPLNILILPWIETLVILGFTTSLIGIVAPPLAWLLNNISSLLLTILDFLVSLANSVPHGYLYVKQIPLLIIVFIFISVFTFTEYLKNKTLLYKKIFYITLLSTIGYFIMGTANNYYLLTMFDVGQGESILIQTPKENILIDCGNEKITQDPGTTIVVPTLIKKGIGQLDYLIITHPHSDHYSGIESIVKSVAIKKAIINKQTLAALPETLLALITSQNITIESPTLLEQLSLNSLSAYVVHTDTYNYANSNNNSLALLMFIQGAKLLLTGDCEKPAEENIQEDVTLENIDILKAGHHGSKTSSSPEFVALLQPKNSIVSVGNKNRYKHPALSTIERLSRYGKTYRTDLCGAIQIEFIKPGNYQIKTAI